MKKQINLSSTTRGALFEKTAPLDPPQKLLITFNRVPLCLRAFVAIFFLLLFSQPVTAQSTGIEKQLEKFKQRLKLSEEQTTKVREILQEVQLQKETDRQTYKTDALALIQASRTRQNHVDNKIEPILDSQQLEEYKIIRKLHPVDRELF